MHVFNTYALGSAMNMGLTLSNISSLIIVTKQFNREGGRLGAQHFTSIGVNTGIDSMRALVNTAWFTAESGQLHVWLGDCSSAAWAGPSASCRLPGYKGDHQ